MPWLRLILSAIVASELLLRLPVIAAIGKATAAAGKSSRVLRSKRISDHWKERMLPVYAGVMARNSLLFFGLLCVAIMPVVLIGLGYPGGLGNWLIALMQPINLGVLCGVSILYMVLRTRMLRAGTGRG